MSDISHPPFNKRRYNDHRWWSLSGCIWVDIIESAEGGGSPRNVLGKNKRIVGESFRQFEVDFIAFVGFPKLVGCQPRGFRGATPTYYRDPGNERRGEGRGEERVEGGEKRGSGRGVEWKGRRKD